MIRNAAFVSRLGENMNVKGILAAVLSLFTLHIWNHITPIYAVFFMLYLADLLTGIAKSLVRNTFSSRGLGRGFGKWAGYSVICGLLLLLTAATKAESTGFVWKWIVDWTLFYLMCGEYTSICENLEIFGVKLPSLNQLSRFVNKVKGDVK